MVAEHLLTVGFEGTVSRVTELMRLIQAHLDRYGVSRAEFARRAGTTPQTIQNWQSRRSSLPQPKHLRGVAEVTGLPYLVVLDAALVDAGYRPSMVDDVPALKARLERLAAEDPAAVAAVADYAAELERAARPAAGRSLEDAQARAAADLIARILRGQFNGDDGDDGSQEAR